MRLAAALTRPAAWPLSWPCGAGHDETKGPSMRSKLMLLSLIVLRRSDSAGFVDEILMRLSGSS
jgi:hypothetical protein